MESDTIEVRGDISPTDLQQIRDAGGNVKRTPHIGNLYPSNLYLLALGLPAVLYDRNTFARDANYHPAVKISSGTPAPLTDARDVFTPCIRRCSPGVNEQRSPSGVHCTQLRKLFGDLVATEAEILARHKDNVLRALTGMTREMPDTLTRVCDRDVGVYRTERGRRPAAAVEVLEALARLPYDSAVEPPHGPVPALPATIALTILAAWWENGTTAFYELAGPDMASYARKKGFRRDVKAALDAVRRHAPQIAPPPIIFRIVPTHAFRFGYMAHMSENKEAALTAREILAMRRSVRSLRKEHGTADARVHDAKQTMQRTLESANIRLIRRHVLYDIHEPTFVSQHDLSHAEDIIVPEDVQTMTFDEMERSVVQLTRLLDEFEQAQSEQVHHSA